MTEPPTRLRLPWGLVLTLAALAAVAALALRLRPGDSPPVPWPSAASAALIAAASFLVLRRLQNYLWGVVAALVLLLHPSYREWARLFEPVLRAEALELLVLVCVVEGWRLAFRPRFAGLAWPLLALGVLLGVGLAWPLLPQAGLVAGLLALVGLPLAAGLAARTRSAPPSSGNVAAALLVGLLAPAGGLLLAPVAVDRLGWPGQGGTALDLLRAAVEPASEGLRFHGFATAELERWCWPTFWVVLPLMAWGLWRSVRRGLRQRARQQPPLAWVLTLYAAVDLLGVALHPATARDTVFLPLALLGLLLAVFCVADLVRGLTDRLVLAPPQERDPAAAG